MSHAFFVRHLAHAKVIAVTPFFILLAACGAGLVVEPVTVATPTALSGDAEQVSPTETTESGGDDTAIVAEAAPRPDGRLVKDAAPTEDMHGNLLTVHAVQAWPESYRALAPLGQPDLPLAGTLDDDYNQATSLVALDLSVCAKTLGDVDVAGGTGTFRLGNELAPPAKATGNGSLSSSDISLVPGFMWPDIGTCSRGWLAVATTADLGADLYAHYLPHGDDDGKNVLAWQVPLRSDQPDTPAASFGAGQTVTFNAGDITGASVVIDGWAELLGISDGPPGTRAVGLSANLCPAEQGAWPAVGLAVDGWNLAEARAGDTGSLDVVSPTADACDGGWLVYDVPLGARPTGAFVAEEPGTPGAYWSLADMALPDPS